MDVVNLTPHAVVLIVPGGHSVTYPSSGEARVEEIPGEAWSAGLYPIPIRGRTEYGTVTGLPTRTPEPIADECISGPHGPPDKVYIVSHLVAERLREMTAEERAKGWGKDTNADLWFKRDDIVTPGDLVRDAQGRVIGCRTFAALW